MEHICFVIRGTCHMKEKENLHNFTLFKVICCQFFVLFLEGTSHGTQVVEQSKI